jgi:hypothetical protein
MDNNSDMSMESNSYSYPESDMDKPRLEKVYIQASLHAVFNFCRGDTPLWNSIAMTRA